MATLNEAQSGLGGILNSKGFLQIGEDISGATDNVLNFINTANKLDGVWTKQNSAILKVASSVGIVGSGLISLGFAYLNVAAAAEKIQGTVKIFNSAYEAVKDVVGVSKTLNFAEAILGSDKFASNLDILEKTADSAFSRIGAVANIAFDNENYKKWSIGAVNAYAPVEQAAFRLATITTKENESALNAIPSRIEGLRKLQKETNNVVDSVSLLNSQYQVASGGFTSRTASSTVTKSATSLSQVGFADLEPTAEGLVKVLSANKALGDTFSSAEKRASQLFATTKVGILTLTQLNTVAAELASTGASAGIGFEEIASALAILTTQGIGVAESRTAITNLIQEIIDNTPAAQSALSTLRDEAGKPIKFGFAALKDEGLISIIERLGKATGGTREGISKIFSSSESTKGAIALLQAGQPARQEIQQTIKKAGTDEGIEKFNQGAIDRSKTLTGNFTAAFNKSQAAVETVGSGLAENINNELANTVKFLDVLSTKSGSAFGTFAGQVDKVATVFGGISKVVGSVFSVVLPLAFFSLVFKNLGRLGSELKRALNVNEGEITWKTVLDGIQQKLVQLIKFVIVQTRNLVAEVNDELSGIGTKTKSKPQQTPIKVETPIQNLNTFQKVQSAFDGIRRGGEGAGKVLAPLGKAIVSITKEVGSFVLSGAAVGGVFALLATGATGAATAFDAFTKPQNIAEVKELAQSLGELKGVAGLSEFISGITTAKSAVGSFATEVDLMTEGVNRLSNAWNILTGQAARNAIFQKINDDAISLLKTQISVNNEFAKAGKLNVTTDEGKAANRKIQLGIQLNDDDIRALEKEAENQKRIIEEVPIRLKAAIESEKERGGLQSQDELKARESELATAKLTAEAQLKNLDLTTRRTVLESRLQRLRSFNSSTPLNIQTAVNINAATKTTVDDYLKQVQSLIPADGLELDISKLDVTAFEQLLPNLNQSLQQITLQADVDPTKAQETLKRFTENTANQKFIASDPNAQKSVDEASAKITAKILERNQNLVASYTKVNDALIAAGAVNADAVIQSTTKNLAVLDSTLRTLEERLKQPLNAADFADTTAKLAAAQAESFQVKNNGQIKAELDGRKQTLSVSQAILDAQKNLVSLLQQESKFGSFSVTLAEAKLSAAEKELQVKKETLSIAAREETITKTNIVGLAQKSLAAKERQVNTIGGNANITEIEKSQGNRGILSALSRQEQEIISNTNKVFNPQIADLQKQIEERKSLENSSQVKVSDDFANNIRKKINDLSTSRLVPIERKAGESEKSADELRQERADRLNKELFTTDNQGNTLVNRFNISKVTDQLRSVDSGENINIKQALFDEIKKATNTTKLSADLKAAQSSKAQKIEEAKSGADSQREALASLDIEGSKKILKKAQDDLNFTIVAQKVKQELGTLAERIALNTAKIDAAYAKTERQLAIARGIGESFKGLSSQVGDTLGSSGLSATFNRIGVSQENKVASSVLDASKELSKVQSRLNTIQQTRDIIIGQQREAQRLGVKSPDIDQAAKDVNKQFKTAAAEAQRDIAFIKQKTILDSVSGSLEVFGSIASEAAAKMQTTIDNFNSKIELESRKEQSQAGLNSSVRSFQNGILGLLGQNNPFAKGLQGANEIEQIKEDRNVKLNEASRSAEKEFLALDVQREQLTTQLKTFENAVTQTTLLSAIVEKINPETGISVNQAQITSAQSTIADLPGALEDSRRTKTRQLENLQNLQNFIPQELINNQARIKTEAATSALSVATINPLGGLFGRNTIQGLISDSTKARQSLNLTPIQERQTFGQEFQRSLQDVRTQGANARTQIDENAKRINASFKQNTEKINLDFKDTSPNKAPSPGNSSTTSQQAVSINIQTTVSNNGVSSTANPENIADIAKGIGKDAQVVQKALDNFTQGALSFAKGLFS